ncbi:YggT family protein [Nocardia uniformis]|uniref:YggT family protein n=1 Tax=Nocardia uniformis TaxID=53432 RepID=A0A849CJY7_9NOCA|nr:YggT family protein [Nocardia uniformis]NNH75121.1 YggT family protein [Nocardia uniformis]
MSLIGTLIGYALTVFILFLIARLIVDWIITLSSGPADWVYKTRDITHRLTEPVIAPVRRVLPPLRAGGIGIDLAFTIVFIAAILLRAVAFSL